MKDLYNELRSIPAVAAMPEEDIISLTHTVYSELELRVGTALSEGLSEAQLQEFETLMEYTQNHPEHGTDNPATAWLAHNVADYRRIVQATVLEVVAETAAAFTPHP